MARVYEIFSMYRGRVGDGEKLNVGVWNLYYAMCYKSTVLYSSRDLDARDVSCNSITDVVVLQEICAFMLCF